MRPQPRDPLWWFDQAACNGMDRREFMSPANGHIAHRSQRVCAGCPVEMTCLFYGMSMETPSFRYGIFGGLLPSQRDELAIIPEIAEAVYHGERARLWEEQERAQLPTGASSA
jgi:hypothetical protein